MRRELTLAGSGRTVFEALVLVFGVALLCAGPRSVHAEGEIGGLLDLDGFFEGLNRPVLEDGRGFFWDFAADGQVRRGSFDAFDGSLRLRVNGVAFPFVSSVLLSPDGSRVIYGPRSTGDLEVTRSVFVPSSADGFVRYVEIVRNPAPLTRTVVIELDGLLGAAARTVIRATSSEDRVVDEGDDWFVTDDPTDRGGAPAICFVVANRDGMERPDLVALDAGRFTFRYSLTVPACETVAVMHFAAQRDSAEEAVQVARALSNLEGAALANLLPDLVLRVENFRLDTDGDGIPDIVEERLGLDPNDAADGAADLDEDGLTNREEADLGTDLRDADSDDDGLRDGDEVAAGTDPLAADSDGDGALDRVDPFPLGQLLVRSRISPIAVTGAETLLRVELVDENLEPVTGVPLRFTVESAGMVILGGAIEGVVVEGGGTERALVETSPTSGAVVLSLRTVEIGEREIQFLDTVPIGLVAANREEPRYFINCGGESLVDDIGRAWSGDLSTPSEYLVRGPRTYVGNGVADGLSDRCARERVYPREVYNTLRWDDGDVEYRFPVDPGEYRVELLFLEICCSEGCEDLADPQQSSGRCRVFDIWLNGQLVADQFSVPVEALRLTGRTEDVAICRSWDLEAESFVDVRIDDLGSSAPPENAMVSGIAIYRIFASELTASVLVLAAEGDEDGDGSLNRDELARGTDPFLADSDGDGLPDGVETGGGQFVGPADTGSDPHVADSDGDGIADGLEVALGTDPSRDDAPDRLATPFTLASGRLSLGLDTTGGLRSLRLDGSDRSLVAIDVLPASPRPREHWAVRAQRVDGASRSFSDRHPSRPSFEWYEAAGGQDRVVGVCVLPGVGLLRQELEFVPGLDALIIRMRIANASSSSLESLRLLRIADPLIDDEEATLNDVVNVGAARASSTAGSTLLLVSADPRSVASIEQRSVNEPAEVLLDPQDPDLAVADDSVALGFELGALESGESAEIELLYLVAFEPEAALEAAAFHVDRDQDGISDGLELALGLDPDDPADGEDDLDGDGLSNRDEVARGTDLARADTDRDGRTDREEVDLSLDPLSEDSDADGLRDLEEQTLGISIASDPDSDGDGQSDGLELRFGGDPGDPGSRALIPSTAFGEPVLDERYLVAGAISTGGDRALLPRAELGSGGGVFLRERIRGDWFFASFEMRLRVGVDGRSAGLAVVLADAPSVEALVEGSSARLGLTTAVRTALLVEVDLRSGGGEADTPHLGIVWIPDGVPGVDPAIDLPSVATAPLPDLLFSGAPYRLDVEFAGGVLRATVVDPGRGAIVASLSHRLEGEPPLQGFLGVVGVQDSVDHGSQEIDHLALHGRGRLRIDSISPRVLGAGRDGELEILGAGFDASLELVVGGERAEILSLDSSRVRARLPATASPGVFDLVARSIDGGERVPRAVTRGPIVEALEPATGPDRGGGLLLLDGAGFEADREVSVTFGETPSGRVERVGSNLLRVSVPPGPRGLVDVRVSSEGRSTTLVRGFRYRPTLGVPDEFATLQSALGAANDGDLVLVSPGEYEENIFVEGVRVELRSLAGAEQTRIVHSLDPGAPTLRVSLGAELSLRGFDLDGRERESRGGVLVEPQARLTLRDVRVRGHRGEAGHGVRLGEGARFDFDRVVIEDNESRSEPGAGIHIAEYASGRIVNTQVVGNVSGRDGGGISVAASGRDVTILHVTVVGNLASSGAGIRMPDDGRASVRNSILWDNRALRADPDVSPSDARTVFASAISVSRLAGVRGNLGGASPFVDLEGGDLRLRSDTAIIDAGALRDAIAVAKDLGGGERHFDGDHDGFARPDPGALEFRGGAPVFRRGDVDGSSSVEINDGISILLGLFAGGASAPCADAADANDDGRINLTDAVRIFRFLFLGGAEPPFPGPFSCGVDASVDRAEEGGDLGCERYDACE